MVTASAKQLRERKINSAMQAIKHGMPYLEASKQFNVPVGTIHYRMTTPPQKPGRKTALSRPQENEMVEMLLRFARRSTKSVRSMKERRAIAKVRALSKSRAHC